MAYPRCTRVAVPFALMTMIALTLSAGQNREPVHDPIRETGGASALMVEAWEAPRAVGPFDGIQVLSGFQRGPLALSTVEPMALADCVAQAGGLCWWADPSRVLVIRPRGEHKVAFRLHMRHIEALPHSCLMIWPGDQLLVQRYPLFEWASTLQSVFASAELVGSRNARISN
jgi:hypothetical protein